MSHFIRAFVALGSNLHDPARQVKDAFEALDNMPETRLLSRSSLYCSAPWGYQDQPDFVNAVALIETRMTPRQLLKNLLEIEHQRGRVREFPNSPRVLDLDLLAYDGLIYHEHGLTLPHPRMHERAFVLLPLLEIDPAFRIPGLGQASAYLADCAGQSLHRLPDGHGEAPPHIMKHRAAMPVSLSPCSLPEGERNAGSLREFQTNETASIQLYNQANG